MTRYMMGEGGEVIPIPDEPDTEEAIATYAPVEVAPKKRKVVINAGDDMSDMFEVPRHEDADMAIGDLVSVDIERDIVDGDLSDITDVDLGDIIGAEDDDMSDDVLEEYGREDLSDLTSGEPASGTPAPTPSRKLYRTTPKGHRMANKPLEGGGGIQGIR